MLKGGRLRVVTYNVHKCVGLDRRVRPARVAAVLREIDADAVALQEVVSVESDSSREAHQARFIAEELGCEFRVGENRRHKGGAYGNVVLTRLPVLADSVVSGLPHLSYTQWEAYLALYHGKRIHIYRPAEGAPRDATFQLKADEKPIRGPIFIHPSAAGGVLTQLVQR